ncbi:protein Wnt-4-like [Hydractinia symbiolongicarpus]|uniref:protein Wnt-4-like n=1 Tax=Hydractinia symbiolongicarpus TaxID=13093 RepID=UPI00254C5EEA|nr:protein Wnt-4-like [Hydractinia symbiolongicarpus]
MAQYYTKFFLIMACCMNVFAIKWVNEALRDVKKWSRPACTSENFHLNAKQRGICRHKTNFMDSVSSGAADTISSCRTLFQEDSWNCYNILKAPHFDYNINNATKESAFVHALSAAALAYHVATDCASGKIANCRCPTRYQGGVTELPNVPGKVILHSRACPQVYEKGIHFARKFLSPGEKKLQKVAKKSPYRAGQLKIAEHNREVGYKVFRTEKYKYIKCGCRGNTGSCPIKTCYQSIDYFPVMAKEIRKRYDEASRVAIDKKTGALTPTNRIDEIVPEQELIYSDNSLKKCSTKKARTDMRYRRCSLDPNAKDYCKKMCCDGKHKPTEIVVAVQCSCKFVYCCRVDCQWCNHKKMVQICI